MDEEADQAALTELPLSPWQLLGISLILAGYLIFWMLVTGFTGSGGEGIPLTAFLALLSVVLFAPAVGAAILSAPLAHDVVNDRVVVRAASQKLKALAGAIPVVVLAGSFLLALSTGIMWG